MGPRRVFPAVEKWRGDGYLRQFSAVILGSWPSYHTWKVFLCRAECGNWLLAVSHMLLLAEGLQWEPCPQFDPQDNGGYLLCA